MFTIGCLYISLCFVEAVSPDLALLFLKVADEVLVVDYDRDHMAPIRKLYLVLAGEAGREGQQRGTAGLGLTSPLLKPFLLS